MKYEEAKKYIKDGDVLTFAGNWWMSRAIRWWTGQPVSHVGLTVWLRFGQDTEDRLCVLESLEPGGIRIVPLTVAMEDSDLVFWQTLDGMKCNGREALGWAIQKWGGKYASWLQFFSFIFPTFRRAREIVGLPVKIGDGYHCSELVAQALWFGGFTPPKDPALVTPGDFHSTDFGCLSAPTLLER